MASDLFFSSDRPTHPQNQEKTQSMLNKKRDGPNNILKYSGKDNVYLMNILLNHFHRNVFGWIECAQLILSVYKKNTVHTFFFKGFAKIKTSKAFWQSQGQRRSFQNLIDKIFSNIKEKIVSFRWLRKEATRNKTDDISSFSFSYMIVFSLNLAWINSCKFFRRSQTLASNLVILFIF